MLRRLEPPPADVREKMRQIFERREFQRRTGWLARWWKHITDWIGKHLFHRVFGGRVGESAWGGPIGSIILWVVIFLLVVALAVIARRVTQSWRARSKPPKPDVTVDVVTERDAGEWADQAERFEAAGEWKEAVRCRYRELVARLVDMGAASPMAGRTTGELRADVADSSPAVLDAFSEATLLFELPWYAHADTGPQELARFRSLAADVLSRASVRVAETELAGVGS